MSIPLREGFANETLERCLEDLLVRFVVNCPEEDLSSIERVLFQIEEAHWFYQDYLRTLNPLLPSMKMKLFTNKLIEQCPLIWKWGDPSEALAKFGKYKSTIPVRGCALLNTSMDKMLLVKGIESSSWGFPRGKISKDESDVDCALRELDEETGFDASNLIDEDSYVERTIKGKNYKIYIVKGVPDDTKFVPKVRFEIADIQWMDIKYLTKAVKNSSNFYLVGSMFKPIVSYINRVKNSESEEELKRLATAQLKKILGLDGSEDEEKESEAIDPGRELLSMLQSAAKNPQLPSEINTQNNNINASMLQKQLHFQQNQHLVMPHQQYTPPFIPLNQMTFQQNRMVPMVGHNPFALQMFNPYLAFPHYGLSNGNMPLVVPQHINNPLASQSMALAPSASTFSKPQFSLPNKKTNENSKELLSILKSKPLAKKETKKSNSAELLSLLKKEPKKQPYNDNPSGALSTSIKMLKRERPSNNETKINEAQSYATNVNEPKEVFDITKPANITTARDINNVISNGKPIVLLKKPMTKPTSPCVINNVPNTESFIDETKVVKEPSVTEAPINGPLEKKPISNERKQVPVDLLNLLTKPNLNSKNSDPSAQLLNLLKSPIVEKKEEKTESKTPNDPSKDLMNLLKNNTSARNPSTASTNNDQSFKSLHAIKDTQEVLNSTSVDSSKSLLNILKGTELPSRGMSSDSTKESISSNDPSKDLLNILKRTDSPTASESLVESTHNQLGTFHTSNNPLTSAHSDNTSIPISGSHLVGQPKIQPVTQQPQSTTSVLLDMLEKPSNSNSAQSNSVPTGNTLPSMNSNNLMQNHLQKQQEHVSFIQQSNNKQFNKSQYLTQNASSALLGVLKGSNHPQNQQSQFQTYQSSPPQPASSLSQQQQQQISDSSSILAVLKGNGPIVSKATDSAAPINSQVQSSNSIDYTTFEDFADFEDNDDEIEGEYIMNGGLYDS